MLELRFNALAFGGGERLKLQWSPGQYDMSTWAVKDSSSLMICLAQSGTS